MSAAADRGQLEGRSEAAALEGIFNSGLPRIWSTSNQPLLRSHGDTSWTGADWRVGDLYRTTDGGLHWTLVATNPGSVIGCIPASPGAAMHQSVLVQLIGIRKANPVPMILLPDRDEETFRHDGVNCRFGRVDEWLKHRIDQASDWQPLPLCK
jgi:hypothetical protein